MREAVRYAPNYLYIEGRQVIKQLRDPSTKTVVCLAEDRLYEARQGMIKLLGPLPSKGAMTMSVADLRKYACSCSSLLS